MLFFAIIFVVVVLSFITRAPRLVGDVHARLIFVSFYITVGLLTCRKVVFIGDIIDGPKGWSLWKSSLAIKLVRWCPWADCLMGNHEAYSVFSENAEENASFWKEEVDKDGNFRPWNEWLTIRKYLTEGDVEWLKTRPLYIVGDGWFASHAKPVLPLPPKYVVDGKLSTDQIELLDNTKGWFKEGAPYCGSLGVVYVGHTPIQKLNNKKQWGKVIVLDGGSKKGGKPFSAVPTNNDNEFFIAIILMIAMALTFIGISTSVQKVKETTTVMEEVTIVVEVKEKEKPVVKKQVKKKQVKKSVVKKQIKVIDVPGSIRAWNEEAWCRQYWDKGQKCWFKDRQEEYPKKAKAIAKAFKEVWGNEPIEVQKLALAICLKETGCGFSEDQSWKLEDGVISQTGPIIYTSTRFMSSREACGLTQVDTRKGIGLTSCRSLNESYSNAFKWQKVWLKTKWNNGHKRKPQKVSLYEKKWLQPYEIDEDNTSYLVWRYNGGGKKAWRYGRTVMKIYHNYIKVKK